jgi:hypothetical protein
MSEQPMRQSLAAIAAASVAVLDLRFVWVPANSHTRHLPAHLRTELDCERE